MKIMKEKIDINKLKDWEKTSFAEGIYAKQTGKSIGDNPYYFLPIGHPSITCSCCNNIIKRRFELWNYGFEQ